jgi:hypothetical protein
MHQFERERRLHSASGLLFALRVCGCSQRLVAAYLKVSHSTLSHWKGASEDKTRKVGVPSEEQLAKLVGLLRYQLIEDLGHAFGGYDDCGGTRREGALLLHALGSVLREATEYYELRKRRQEELVTRTREFIAAIGLDEAKRTLSPVWFSRWGDDPEPTEAEWKEAFAKSDVEAEEALAAFEVTEADMDRARNDLDVWVKEQRDRLHRETLEKVLREEREKTKPDPD